MKVTKRFGAIISLAIVVMAAMLWWYESPGRVFGLIRPSDIFYTILAILIGFVAFMFAAIAYTLLELAWEWQCRRQSIVAWSWVEWREFGGYVACGWIGLAAILWRWNNHFGWGLSIPDQVMISFAALLVALVSLVELVHHQSNS